MTDTRVRSRGRLQMPRSRGALSGFLLILLGLWGALIPFVGPYFDFAFTPDQAWAWTAARGWLEVLPGAATVVGGLLLLVSRNRATAMLGGWLSVIAGAWFVVGRALAGPLGIGEVGSPVAAVEAKRVLLDLAYFYGLGALIIFLGAVALGRLSVRSARDIEWAERPVATTAERPVATSTTPQPQPPPSDEVTEIQPAMQPPTTGPPRTEIQPRTGPTATQPPMTGPPRTGIQPTAEPKRRNRLAAMFDRRRTHAQ